MPLRRLLRPIVRLFRIPARERRDLLRAQWYVVRAQARMWRVPEGQLMREWTQGGRASLTTPSGNVQHLPRALAVGHAVRRVGAFGLTRPKCLARSLAISAMLEHEGIGDAVIHIGVRPGKGSLEAHAWVEYAGQIVGDSPAHVRSFADFATARAADFRTS